MESGRVCITTTQDSVSPAAIQILGTMLLSTALPWMTLKFLLTVGGRSGILATL